MKVLVVGDVMLDRYWWGSVSRISPEAPVPIVRLEKTSLAIGGAANVAANVAGLGAQSILIGVVGADGEAEQLAALLENLKISAGQLVRTATRPTTLKTRIVAHHQQVVRVDQEVSTNIPEALEAEVWQRVTECLDEVRIVIVSDYAKGLLTPSLLLRLITSCKSRQIPVIVDPKGKDFGKYKNADILTPNRKEAFDACGVDSADDKNDLELVGRRLMADLALGALLVTLGEDGIALFRSEEEVLHQKALARHVYDVTGAGDTVIATLAAGLGAGLDLVKATELANAAAGLVVEEVGTTVIGIDKLINYIGIEQ